MLLCLQVEHLAIALREFEWLSRAHRAEGAELISRANQPGWIFAAAAKEAAGSLDSAQASPAATAAAAADSSAASAAGAADATAGPSGNLDHQLMRHVKARQLHMVSLHMVMANTLTRWQLAQMLVRNGYACVCRVGPVTGSRLHQGLDTRTASQQLHCGCVLLGGSLCNCPKVKCEQRQLSICRQWLHDCRWMLDNACYSRTLFAEAATL